MLYLIFGNFWSVSLTRNTVKLKIMHDRARQIFHTRAFYKNNFFMELLNSSTHSLSGTLKIMYVIDLKERTSVNELLSFGQ